MNRRRIDHAVTIGQVLGHYVLQESQCQQCRIIYHRLQRVHHIFPVCCCEYCEWEDVIGEETKPDTSSFNPNRFGYRIAILEHKSSNARKTTFLSTVRYRWRVLTKSLDITWQSQQLRSFREIFWKVSAKFVSSSHTSSLFTQSSTVRLYARDALGGSPVKIYEIGIALSFESISHASCVVCVVGKLNVCK